MIGGVEAVDNVSTLAEARALAMALPEVAEQDHHGIESYRVRGKIFATIPDNEHVRIMVDEAEILSTVAGHGNVCSPFYWGERLACVVVEVAPADSELLRDLLTDAWLRKAPKALARTLGVETR